MISEPNKKRTNTPTVLDTDQNMKEPRITNK